MKLTKAQREVLERLTNVGRGKLTCYLPRSQARAVRGLERLGLVVRIRAMEGVLVLGEYRLTSRGWAAVGRGPCRGVVAALGGAERR